MRVKVPRTRLYIALAIVAVIAILAIIAPNIIVRATEAGHFNEVQHVIIDTADPAPAADADTDPAANVSSADADTDPEGDTESGGETLARGAEENEE